MTDADICDAGTCVECTVTDDSACGSGETCDLVDFVCVGTGPGAVGNCEVCTNDEQCESGYRCIPMQFQQSPHGNYCLEDASSGCQQPFGVGITAASINGAAPVEHCGIEEELATCEAVLALMAGWVCTGNDQMCGPQGQSEVAVPGALCRQVDTLANRCTYACATGLDCPAAGPPSSCGHSGGTTPDWCGG